MTPDAQALAGPFNHRGQKARPEDERCARGHGQQGQLRLPFATAGERHPPAPLPAAMTQFHQLHQAAGEAGQGHAPIEDKTRAAAEALVRRLEVTLPHQQPLAGRQGQLHRHTARPQRDHAGAGTFPAKPQRRASRRQRRKSMVHQRSPNQRPKQVQRSPAQHPPANPFPPRADLPHEPRTFPLQKCDLLVDPAPGGLDAGLRLRLQLLIYPGTTAHQDTASHQCYAQGFLLDKETVDWFFAQYIDVQDRSDWRFAPLNASDHSNLAPAWLGLAECDPLVDEGIAYADALRMGGVAVDLNIYRGVIHGFMTMGRAIVQARQAHADAAAALRAAFGSGGGRSDQAGS